MENDFIIYRNDIHTNDYFTSRQSASQVQRKITRFSRLATVTITKDTRPTYWYKYSYMPSSLPSWSPLCKIFCTGGGSILTRSRLSLLRKYSYS